MELFREILLQSTANGFSLWVGGDSVATVKQFGLEEKAGYGWWCHAGNAGSTHFT
jgi:6-phosphogluconate dehydrogenase (decarboxylating)